MVRDKGVFRRGGEEIVDEYLNQNIIYNDEERG